ncbi:golgi protein 1, putative [Plasmodium ovale]|uniref:Golgi protein 1, putative n=1 Tax=Plasmodium ovale TaxID=36330 RepID=A0A1C3L4U9_PLAOA|nr:golgi protein 1, putative [Plasmodium ovale]
MVFTTSIRYFLLFIFISNLLKLYADQNECDFHFDVSLLSNVYDKYNGWGGKKVEEQVENTNHCNNLESINSLKAFWMLKLKSLCTEETSILDKQVFNNICSKKYTVPHVTINGLELGNEKFNIEFFCAHFLYSNNKEIIKCVKHNILKNYLDTYHIAFDLSVSHELLKQSNHVDTVLNLKDINGLALVKRIVDDSVCRIHSSVHTIMNKQDYDLLKSLVGLCTKLGFHNHFIITDNIHPLANPLFKEIPYSLNSLNFVVQNSTLFYTNYEYFLYNLKLADIEYILGSYISPSALTISKNNSYVTWIGLNKDNDIYNKKFTELYSLLDNKKYFERIVQCYSKYTSKYYANSIKYFLRYIPENKRDVMQNSPKIFIYIINGICGNIPSIHKCVEKIIFLDGVYDLYFKNFMINFIYYNAACIFNCNPLDLGKVINDEHVWDILIRYFSNSYLVKYKKIKNASITGGTIPTIATVPSTTAKEGESGDGNTGPRETTYNQMAKSFYTIYDYDYVHSGKWRKELNLEDEEAILKPSDDVIEYEFYNYTYQSLDLSSYSFFILKNQMEEDNVCKISSFVEANGKKYVHVNRYIAEFFNKSNKRVLSNSRGGDDVHDGSGDNGHDGSGDDGYDGSGDDGYDESGDDGNGGDGHDGSGDNGHDGSGDNGHDGSGDDGHDGSGEDGGDNHVDSFNLFDDFLGDDKEGGNFMDLFQNNQMFNKNKLFDNLYHGDGDEDEEEGEGEGEGEGEDMEMDKETEEPFDLEKHKISTRMGDIYPLKNEYTLRELQHVFDVHPDFSDLDEEIRHQFFRNKLFEKELFFTVKDVPTKIENFYEYYYEIKKKLKKFDKYDEEKYKVLVNNKKEDPDAFSKINVEFTCSRSGKWPVRGTTGRWLSDVLCEAKFVPQLIYNHQYAENSKYGKNAKRKTNSNMEKNEIDPDLYTLKEDTRLIGIEFEDQEPHRCAISYLGDENKKTLIPVSAALLVHVAVGYCILHGFKTIWIADSAFDIYTNVYLRYTSILEQGKTYYEQSGFEIYGQTRLIAQLEYIASGMNIENNIITSGSFKNRYNLISFPGVDLSFQLLMSKRVKDIIYNLKFDCHSWEFKGCSEYYPLMKNNKKNVQTNYNTIILNGKYTQKEKEKMYECAFMHDETFKELNKMFPQECTFNSRIGDCHKKIRKHIMCYDEHSCKYLRYIYDNFYKPQNNANLLHQHFISVSENLTKLSRPYYLQSILSLEHDIQIKKSKKKNTQYEDIVLFILKNSIFYVSWVTSSEYWKRSLYVQDLSSLTPSNIKDSTENKRELFCPVAYAHEYIGHMLVQYMKFPNN